LRVLEAKLSDLLLKKLGQDMSLLRFDHFNIRAKFGHSFERLIPLLSSNRALVTLSEHRFVKRANLSALVGYFGSCPALDFAIASARFYPTKQ
jgi:hypothetical protein